VLECVVNVSEGRDLGIVAALADAAGPELLDVHTDPHHHRSVFTLVGEQAPRRLAAATVGLVDIRQHDGVHPRLGAVDVVPFVPLAGSTMDDAERARDGFCRWAGDELAVPCFRYGGHRTLPELRRRAWVDLSPDCGPHEPHPSAGACCVGARDLLVAYNLWLTGADLAQARAVAAAARGDGIRALGLQVGGRLQVSMNLVEPGRVGPGHAWDRVSRLAREAGAAVAGAELVGWVPEAVLTAEPEARWPELDLTPDRTIEARVRATGARGGG
jgi:glutamate formiminotransferase